MRYTRDQLDGILDEVAGFEVELAEDPTLPHLRSPYLQRSLSLCRKYLNRTVYYMQKISTQLKVLRREVREIELDIELKMAEKLADDELVRKQPSIEDRKALATSLLRDEHERAAVLRVDLIDFEETFKIVKLKHGDLVRTNADIKMQRQIIRDEKELGETGYGKPQTSSRGTVPDGMPPAVDPERIDPTDLLDPEKRPADMPEPVDAVHAQQLAAYYSPAPIDEEVPPRQESPVDTSDEEAVIEGPSYDDLLQ